MDNLALFADRLLQLKREKKTTFAVVFPARNEQATIGHICSEIIGSPAIQLLDELVVMNDRSTDKTESVVQSAFDESSSLLTRKKCRAYNTEDITEINNQPLPLYVGKGAVCWKSLFCVHSDVVIFLDSDHEEFKLVPLWILRFMQCFLENEHTQFVKGYFAETILNRDGVTGRVSDLCMIPLLSILYPGMRPCIHIGCGEQAAPRKWLMNIDHFPAHYAMECALWIHANSDFCTAKSEIMEIDLVTKVAKKQSTVALRSMSATIMSYLIRKKFNLWTPGKEGTTSVLGNVLKAKKCGVDGVSEQDINVDVFPSAASFLRTTNSKNKQQMNTTNVNIALFAVSLLIIICSIAW